MARTARLLLVSLLLACKPAGLALAKSAPEAMGQHLWQEAVQVQTRFAAKAKNDRYMVVIDYSRPSAEPRFFLVDLKTGSANAFLVSHGRGSDPDHDGMADRFSNVPGSKMTSLGAFVTAETYYGKHGLSLRLDGLETQNSAARERAIVIHGADYVSPQRKKMGRSWGCPALERRVALDLIPKIANGVLVYTYGPQKSAGLDSEIVDQAG